MMIAMNLISSILLQSQIQPAGVGQIVLAVAPVLLLVALMGFLKMPGDKSSFITLLVTVLLAIFAFRFPLMDTSLSVLYGILKAIFPILIIIIMAIFSYNVLVFTGKMEIIKQQFISISSDRAIQVLLLTWGFGSFLEGMAGFGTAVAIPAALLISLGFKPVFSALVSLIANSVATGFGAVGTPVKVLAEQARVTDIQTLSTQVIFQLSPLMILIPFVLMYLTEPKAKAIPKYVFVSLLVGVVSIVVQYLAARYMGAETPAILGSIASIITIVLYAKISERKKGTTAAAEKAVSASTSDSLKAWSVYGLILALVILTSPLLPLREMLTPLLKTIFNFEIFNVASGKDVPHAVKIYWLVDTGILLFLGSMLGGIIQGAGLGELFKLLWKVFKQQKKTIVTVCSLIALSSVMDFSGMIGVIGVALAFATGSYYPLFAPTIGCLGTFLTGSDTSSNILFGKLQASVAHQIGENGSWLAAANTAGATGGKIISPQSIAVATSAIGQQGQEGAILKKAVPFALGYIVIAGLMVYFLPKILSGLLL
mgnify:CR=1 FL=1